MIAPRAEVLTILGLTASPTAAQLGLVTLLHPLAERAVKDLVGYEVESGTYTELYPLRDYGGANTDLFVTVSGDSVYLSSGRAENQVLQLLQLPVRSITEVREDLGAMGGQASGAFPASTVLTAGTDYYLDIDESGLSRTGHLYRIGAGWPQEARTVKVTYTAGYTASELDNRYAAFRTAVLLTMQASYTAAIARQAMTEAGAAGPLIAERLDDWSATYANPSFTGSAGSDLIVMPGEAKRMLMPFLKVSG